MKAYKFFLLFLILLIPLSYGYDCSIFQRNNYSDCVILNNSDENLIANMIYTITSIPDYEFVKNYNDQIFVNTAPDQTPVYNSGVIRNAWIKILTINPAIKYQNSLLIPSRINARAEYNYSIILPENYDNDHQVDGEICKITYTKNSENSDINWFADDRNIGHNKNIEIIAENYSQLSAQTDISVTYLAENYVWDKYCCAWHDGHCTRYCFDCDYRNTNQITDTLIINDSVNVTNFADTNIPSFTLIDEYLGTNKGVINKDNYTSIKLSFVNSSFEESEFVYSANFTNKPFYFLEIIATKQNIRRINNLIYSNNNIYENNASNCSLQYYDFFNNRITECETNLTDEQHPVLQPSNDDKNLYLLFKILVFVAIIFIIYKVIKFYWGKYLLIIPLIILLIPGVSAADDCGITNLATCIPQKIFEFVVDLLNAPIEPLLDWVKNLFIANPSTDLFLGVWAIIVYCLSLFYGLLIVYSGFLFLISGHDVMKREMAKEWLKNTIIMIVLIQASFYLYSLVVEIGARMTSGVFTLIDTNFFRITVDNIVNLGLEFIFLLLYIIILLLTLIFLILRYLVVALGVLFVPIGIFCYFIPPLKSFGKLILYLLAMLIFVTFLDAIIILACSRLIELPLFANMKILVMITCFAIINLLFIILGMHIIHKTSIDDGIGKIAAAGKYIGGMF